jgi:hypothetical protein
VNPIGRSMMDSAACVIAQQCSCTTFVSLPLLSRKEKFGIPIAVNLKLRNFKLLKLGRFCVHFTPQVCKKLSLYLAKYE